MEKYQVVIWACLNRLQKSHNVATDLLRKAGALLFRYLRVQCLHM